jgi:glycosyltransferase involved in cell wall biosynthesis
VAEAASVGALAFIERGWEVEVATDPVLPPRTNLHWHGARIHEFSISGSSYFRDPFRGQVRQYQDLLISGNWDVVIFHAYLWPLHLAIPVLGSIRSKKVLVSHGYAALRWTPVAKFPFGLLSWANSVGQSLKMLNWVRKIDRWVFLSSKKDLHGFYDHWLADKISHPGITVIPNGVAMPNPPKKLGTFRSAHRIPIGAPFFLCVANYSRRKDQGYAVRAFRRAAIPGSHLVFIGSEFNESSARFQVEDAKIAEAFPPGKIHWLQKVSREETLAALADCDAFVLSANHEGQPIVLLEAMAHEKPWIARKAGCIEQLPGGLCVSTIQKMAEAMRKMSVNHQERTHLGAEGSMAVQRQFSRQEYCQSYCQMVERLVGNKI